MRGQRAKLGQLQARECISNTVINASYVANHYVKVIISSHIEQGPYQVH